MPTYDYECQKCGDRYELFQSITEQPNTRCPKCGGKAQRLISGGAGLLFKGSGFYITDYRSESYKKRAAQESSSSSSSGTSSDSKSSGSDSSKKKEAAPKS